MTLTQRLRHLALQAVAGLALMAGILPVAEASVVDRPFTSRYQTTGRVDSFLVGNSVLNCQGGCAAQNGSGNNNSFTMVHIDVDSDGTTFNSSRANFTLPAGATVLRAFLYWGADTSAGTAGTVLTPAPDAAARNTVQFATPVAGYTPITAATLTDSTVQTTRYTAVADVTAQVAAGGTGNYTVANVQAGNGQDRYGGWSLVVIVSDPAAPLRSVTLFDGAVTINTTAPTSITTTVTGFRTPATGLVGARVGLVAFEGDNALTGDQFQVNGTNLDDAVNPTGNSFNSTNSRLGVLLTGRTPQQSNLLGLDIDFIGVAEGVIANNATSANLTFSTTQDFYFPLTLLFQTNVYEPEIVTNFTKSAADVNGGQFRPGDVVTYTINLSNTGDDSSDATVINDPLPAGVTYVPGSLQVVSGPNAGAKSDASGDDQAEYIAGSRTVRFRVGTGANATVGGRITPVASATPAPSDSATVVRFQVTIDANQANGTSIANQAGVTYVGATSGVAGNGNTLPSTFSVSRNADISITKTGTASVLPGGAMSYTVTVSSAGPDAADGATVTDDVPNAITGVSITCSASGGAVCPNTAGLTDLTALAIPTFPSGGQVVFTITGTAPNAATTLSNSASAAAPSGTVDPTPANNSAGPVTTTVTPSADVSLVKTLVTAGPYRRGQAVQYSIVVSNAGPSTATNVQVTDTPTNLTITSVTGGGCSALPCSIASIASGASVTLTVNATINAAGAFDNAATATSTVSDPDAGNNTDPSGNGGTAVESADLSVTKTAAVGPSYPGQNLTYTITVSNAGPSASSNATLNDTLPAGTTFVSLTTPAGWSAVTPAVGAGGTITATNPSLAAGASATFTLTVAVPANTAGGTSIANTASVSSATDDPTGANDASTATVTITPQADIALSKTLLTPGPYVAGQVLTYSIVVSNGGPSTATNVQVTDTPTNLTITSVTGGGCSALPCTIASIASGASATLTVTATINASGAFDNAAAATATQNDPTPGNNGDSTGNGGTAAPVADLAVAKTRTSATPAPTGSTVTYQIVATNNGPSAVVGATLTDTVPPQLTGVTWTCAPALACSATSGTGDVSLALNLLSGASATVSISGTAPATTATPIAANTATIAPPAGTVDPTPGNDSSTTPAIPVAARPIDAVNDAGSIGGAAGGTAVASVLGNDLLDGATATTSTVTISIVTPASNAGVVLDIASGAVTVAAGTPAGTYTIDYRICETSNPTNCDDATVTVTVAAATLVATNDAGSVGGAAGGIAVPNVLANDTINGAQATLSNVALRQVSTSNPGVTLDPATGRVNVAAGTAEGTYTLVYEICELLNPTNCTTATVTVTVTAATLVANTDAGSANGRTGGTAVPNVLANDTVNGTPATLANVTLSQVSTSNPAVTLDPATGAVNVAPGTPAGPYTLTYRICEQLNPTNCTTTTVTVTVTAAVIDAVNDTAGPVPGNTGASNVVNVLVNDTLGGAATSTADVSVTPATAGPLSLDASGNVSVAPNTPAGTYVLTYQICEQLNPTNCDTATVTVTVTAPAIVAVDDTAPAPIGGAAGGTAIASVLGNDTLGGGAATTSNVAISVVTPASNAGIVLNTSTGAVTVAAGTPAGTYTLTYRICDTLNPTNCDDAVATVTVAAATLVATDDSGTVGGAAGGVGIANVLANDTVNGAPATLSNVTLSQVSTSNPAVTLDPATGRVNVAAGTPAGTYTLTYRICEQLNPTNCTTAVATVTVTASAIDAVDDVVGPVVGSTGGSVGNVRGNDMLGGATPTASNTTLAQVSTSNPGVTLDTATGQVAVAAGTPAGSYTLVYRLCEVLNPSNCDTATVTVTVTAAPIDAVDDAVGPVVGSAGGRSGNVRGNDTLGGATPTASNTTLAQVSTSNPGVTLDTATGEVVVATGTPAGSYTLVYRLCEVLNPTNCDTATVTVTVSAAAIDAVDDATAPVNGVAGATNVVNVLGNDTLGGAAASTSTATLSTVSTSNPGVTLDAATGAVNVAAGTPAGTYTLVYRLCEQLNPTNCDTATVTVNVVAPAIAATNDTGSTRQNTAVVLAVLGNDTLGGAPANSTQVTVSITAVPANGSATVNGDGTVTYTPAVNYAGNDVFTYRICDRVNPTVCATAQATVTITPNEVDARDETITSPQTGPVRIDVMGRTRNGGGAPLDPASVRIVTPPSSGTAVVNPDGSITYTPEQLFIGTVTFSYRVCDTSRPTPVCDVATVSITVTAAAPQLRLTKTAPPRAVKVGDLVRYTVVVENTGIAPANGAVLVDTPPSGFTFVEGSLSVDDGDDRFVLAGTDPLRIGGIDVAVGQRAAIVYVLRVGAGVGRGTHVNRVSATDATGSTVSNTATADVVVEGDPLTEDSLILGTVFVDSNGDGVQQSGEPGLPGVRIASVEGLLMETDVHGRYHVAGIDAQNPLRGRNYILKVDAATLPPGTTFTTANPLVRRITPGIPVRFDFGVRLLDDGAASNDATR
ncbi:Ig-like domain-containing protein [Lysobacter humi (ex Lee et al. 2017)]